MNNQANTEVGGSDANYLAVPDVSVIMPTYN